MIGRLEGTRFRQLVAAALLVVPFAVFFAPTLIAGNAPGAFDLSFQSSPWRDLEARPLDAQSPVQIDQAEQLPWVDGMWDSLSSGHLPLWTPAVGGGTSLGTNPVFATYSVFTVVGQLFGGAVGLAIRVLLAVAVAELFTYLLARRVGVSAGGAVLASVAYVFSGATVAFETRNAVPLLFPVVLWCVDRAAERVTPGRMVAVAASVLALWLEGFPAMMVHALAISGLWWVVRSWGRRGWDLIRSGAAFAVSLGLGVLLSAFSAVPFALQLGYNDVFAARATEATALPASAAWWLVDERGVGVPARGPWYSGLNPFEGLAAVGTVVMVLAVIGLLAGALRSRAATEPGADGVRNFWAITAAVLVVAIYLGGPLLDLLYGLPGFSGNPFSRIRFVVAFGLAVLAGLGVTELERLWGDRVTDDDSTEAPAGSVDGRKRWLQIGVAAAAVAGIAAPFVDSLGDYIDLIRPFGSEARWPWVQEAVLLGIGVVAVALVVVVGRRVPERFRPVRTLVLGGVAATVAFTQVGLQITRFTPQVDRSFYYPATDGYARLREVAGDRYRFIGSGMGTFAPNTAMGNGVYDARSHSFRDPQWKALVLSVFPDATAIDPLKINVDFHGNVLWDAPMFDDLSLGVLAMSSSEVPLGDRVGAPVAESWTEATTDRDVTGSGPSGPFVGYDLRLRTSGDCAQGVVRVTARSGGRSAVSTRPLGDARAAAAAAQPLPFASPMDDAGPTAPSTLTVSVDGAPADCRLGVGRIGEGLAVGAISRPADAPWTMVSADGGWLYGRPSAEPLVRLVSDWTSYGDRQSALEAAISPDRDPNGPLPVAYATMRPGSSAPGTVRRWSTDDSGLSVDIDATGPSVLVAGFNAAPGWTATVDGRDANLVEPDGAFLGVEVGPGRHSVRFDYAPPGLRIGFLLSLVGLVGCLVLPFGPRLWRRARRGVSDPSSDASDEPTAPDEASPGTPTAVAPD